MTRADRPEREPLRARIDEALFGGALWVATIAVLPRRARSRYVGAFRPRTLVADILLRTTFNYWMFAAVTPWVRRLSAAQAERRHELALRLGHEPTEQDIQADWQRRFEERFPNARERRVSNEVGRSQRRRKPKRS